MPLDIFICRIISALIAGTAIGLERQLRRRNAGLAVNALVSVGACVFILLSESVIYTAIQNGGPVNNDNLRVLSQIVTGIGFLGAGVIMKDGFSVHGLNSAATIWCSAAVGSLCGYGMWRHAAIAVAVILFINWIIKNIEVFVEKRHDHEK
ncbi:MAG: MgtC/SapB family protein [Bacteroidales bacterium]|nr:MgtC/SapB family protein [Candidatus Colimorpha merdihippi]MCQ2283106.1 MgtC/SapB family protein [Bacteroidales bacterium]